MKGICVNSQEKKLHDTFQGFVAQFSKMTGNKT